MKPEPVDGTCRFGKQIIGQQLFYIHQETAGVQTASDIESIHRMRVATRRLRAILDLFLPCFPARQQKLLTRQIRQVTRSLGRARDLDVQIELLNKTILKAGNSRISPGLNRLLLRLTQERAGLQPDVILSITDLEKSGVLDLEQPGVSPEVSTPAYAYANSLYRTAALAIRSRLSDFLAFEPFIADPAAAEQLHAMRIAAKWLRYNLEAFSPLYSDNLKNFLQACRTAQELLGNIHDCDVWMTVLPKFLEEEKARIINFYGHTRPLLPLLPGIQFLIADRQEERKRSYDSLMQNWQKWKEKLVWGKLRQQVDLPVDLIPSGGLYPVELPTFPGDSTDKQVELAE